MSISYIIIQTHLIINIIQSDLFSIILRCYFNYYKFKVLVKVISLLFLYTNIVQKQILLVYLYCQVFIIFLTPAISFSLSPNILLMLRNYSPFVVIEIRNDFPILSFQFYIHVKYKNHHILQQKRKRKGRFVMILKYFIQGIQSIAIF